MRVLLTAEQGELVERARMKSQGARKVGRERKLIVLDFVARAKATAARLQLGDLVELPEFAIAKT
jgi:hypothetical protein